MVAGRSIIHENHLVKISTAGELIRPSDASPRVCTLGFISEEIESDEKLELTNVHEIREMRNLRDFAMGIQATLACGAKSGIGNYSFLTLTFIFFYN
jgi:hypothetical protein